MSDPGLRDWLRHAEAEKRSALAPDPPAIVAAIPWLCVLVVAIGLAWWWVRAFVPERAGPALVAYRCPTAAASIDDCEPLVKEKDDAWLFEFRLFDD